MCGCTPHVQRVSQGRRGRAHLGLVTVIWLNSELNSDGTLALWSAPSIVEDPSVMQVSLSCTAWSVLLIAPPAGMPITCVAKANWYSLSTWMVAFATMCVTCLWPFLPTTGSHQEMRRLNIRPPSILYFNHLNGCASTWPEFNSTWQLVGEPRAAGTVSWFLWASRLVQSVTCDASSRRVFRSSRFSAMELLNRHT